MSEIKTFEEAAEAFEKIGKLRFAVGGMLDKLDEKIKADEQELEFFDAAERLVRILSKSDTKTPQRASALAIALDSYLPLNEQNEITQMRILQAYLTEVRDRLDRFAEQLRKK